MSLNNRPQLLKDGALIDDPFVVLGAEDTITDGPVIVSPDRFAQADQPGRRIGLSIANTLDVHTIANLLPRVETVVLNFPKFTDGRAYSQARLLRERLNYRGELRATGQVLPDQLAFMIRCGFDAFVLAKGDPIESWQRAKTTFSGSYQPAADDRRPAFIRRRNQG
jgi:uncharacterized protein (DUF934 family)